MKFLFKIPSRGRPELFKKNILKWVEFLSNENEYLFLFTFDQDDEKMNNESIKEFLSKLPTNIEYHYGDSKNKIEATNRDLINRDFDILMIINDDLEPLVKNFDTIIVEIFSNNKNKLDSVINFLTVNWHDKLICFPIMGKKYFDRFGYIMFPGYKSLAADNEFTYVAKLLNKEIFDERNIFFHNYIIGDETQLRNKQFEEMDFEIFYERKKRNFDLGETEIRIEDLNLPY